MQSGFVFCQQLHRLGTPRTMYSRFKHLKCIFFKLTLAADKTGSSYLHVFRLSAKKALKNDFTFHLRRRNFYQFFI